MLIAALSPPGDHEREAEVLAGLLAAGLVRYHVRKPDWPLARTEAWIQTLPAAYRPHLILHGPAERAAALELGGSHQRDGEPAQPAPRHFSSTSRHDLAGLEQALGHYDAVFFGPIFPSLSKPGYGPTDRWTERALTGLLARYRAEDAGARRTQVLAIGGVTADRLDACRALGFDGAAALGALWGEADPVQAWRELQAAARPLEKGRHAA